MANKREFKKDVNYLLGEVFADCYLHMHFHKAANQEKVMEILSEAVAFRNDMIVKINHTETKDKKANKTQYKALYNEMLNTVDGLFGKLSGLSK
jgi:hypothetical protein